MLVNPTSFLVSFATAIGLAAAVDTTSTTKRALWANQANEKVADEPYAVLTKYGSPTPGRMLNIPGASIQVLATGRDEGLTALLAQKIYEALHEAPTAGEVRGRPKCGWVFPGWKIAGGALVADTDTAGDGNGLRGWEVREVLPLQEPGKIGRDERGWFKYVFNMQVVYQPA